MAQHDYNIANASGASVRADLNNALSAVVSQNSGAAEPSTTFAYMMWVDTTNGLVKMRNAANSAWITLFELGVNYPSFPSGTLALFPQTSAPTGWTKQTTHNDKALRVVSGTASSGGTNSFSASFNSSISVDAHTLSVTEIPSHNHPGSTAPITFTSQNQSRIYGTQTGNTNDANIGINIASQGGGGSHSHTKNFALQYVDVIIAQKD